MYIENSLFAKYFKRRDEEAQQKDVISKIILQKTNISVSPQLIHIKNEKIRLSLSPIQKNEIFFKKDLILEALSSCGKFTDIV